MRKLFHVFVGSSVLSIIYYLDWDKNTASIILGVATAFMLLFEIIRVKITKINELFIRTFKAFVRQEEKHKMLTVSYYFLGMFLTFLFFKRDIAILSILYLTFADPSAALIGKAFGKVKLIPNKTLEGSLSFGLVCLIINSLYAPYTHTDILTSNYIFYLAPVAGMLAEFIVVLDDNLSIPIIAGGLLTLLEITNFTWLV